jgi:hypothetical protein
MSSGQVKVGPNRENLFPEPPGALPFYDASDFAAALRKSSAFRMRGLIASLTFVACGVAADDDGEAFVKVLRRELAIKGPVRAPKRNGWVYPSGGAVMMDIEDPGKLITQKDIGKYIFTIE